MKKILSLIIILCFMTVAFGQVRTKVQKGIVRTQSFTNKPSRRIVGAVVVLDGEGANPAESRSLPEEGYFELSLDKLKGNKGIYSIESVTGPKGTRYKLLYPTPGQLLQFTPDASLVIIMQSREELRQYEAYVRENALRDANARHERELAALEERYRRGQIDSIAKQRQVEELQQKLDDFEDLIAEYLYKTIRNLDFESLNNQNRAVLMAMEQGDYARADSLLALRSDEERWESFTSAREDYTKKKEAYDDSRKNFEQTREITINELNQMVLSALNQFDYDRALDRMQERLRYEPDNVDFLCDLGRLLHVRFTDYRRARDCFGRAIHAADSIGGTDNLTLARCHIHMGDALREMCEYAGAIEHYTRGSELLRGDGSPEAQSLVYDALIGTGSSHVGNGDYRGGKPFMTRCAADGVRAVNPKAYWQGRLGLAVIMYAHGDYRGARAALEDVLGAIASDPAIDIETKKDAYCSLIACLNNVGEYGRASQLCDEAMAAITAQSSPNSCHVASLMLSRAETDMGRGDIAALEADVRRASDIYRDILGDEHPSYAMACANMSAMHMLTGHPDDARDAAEKACRLLARRFGPLHPGSLPGHYARMNYYSSVADYRSAAAQLDTIGMIYERNGIASDYQRAQQSAARAQLDMAMGQTRDAVKSFEEAIRCTVSTIGPDALGLMAYYNSMAGAQLMDMKPDEALRYLDKAQAIADKIYGAGSPQSVMQRANMCEYYDAKGNRAASLRAASEALNAGIGLYGSQSYLLNGLYSRLGDCYLNDYDFAHAQECFQKAYDLMAAVYGEDSFLTADALTKLGAYYMNIGDMKRGLELEERALALLEAEFGKNQPNTLTALLGVCNAKISMGRYDDAELDALRLEAATARAWGKESIRYAYALQAVGNIHEARSEYGDAIAAHRQALAIIDRVMGARSANSVQGYNKLSGLYSLLCDFRESERYNALATEICAEQYGKDNPAYWQQLLLNAMQDANLHRITSARDRIAFVQKKFMEAYGEESIFMVPVLTSLANIELQCWNSADAAALLKRAADIQSATYGADSPMMCGLYSAMAQAAMNMAQYDEAKRLYQLALDIAEKNYGTTNIACLGPLQGLANLSSFTEPRTEHARSLLSRADLISSSAYGSRSFTTASIGVQTANLDMRDGRFDDALRHFRAFSECVGGIMKGVNGRHGSEADAAGNFAQYYLALSGQAQMHGGTTAQRSNAERARAYCREALQVCDSVYGSRSVRRKPYLEMLSQTYLGTGQPDSASVYYLESVDIVISNFGDDNPMLANSYKTLGDISEYEATKQADPDRLSEALEYYRKAIAVVERTMAADPVLVRLSTVDYRFAAARVSLSMGEKEQSLEYLDGIISDLENLDDEARQALRGKLFNTYIAKAQALGTDADYAYAAELMMSVLAKAQELADTPAAVANVQFMLGMAYRHLGHREEALELLQPALDFYKRFPGTDEICKSIRNAISELSL